MAFYREAQLAAESAKHLQRTLVWDVPLGRLRRSPEVESPDCLYTENGRRFKLSATSRPNREDGMSDPTRAFA